jgi:hypothetical protein
MLRAVITCFHVQIDGRVGFFERFGDYRHLDEVCVRPFSRADDPKVLELCQLLFDADGREVTLSKAPSKTWTYFVTCRVLRG